MKGMNTNMGKINFIMLKEEASRCLLCYEPPCSSSCPVGKNPASVIMSLRMDNYKGAALKVEKAIEDLGRCGEACDNKMHCQRNCVRGKIDRPIKIRMVQEALCL
ncbi:hypothetical protein [Clostridium thailandense]|nr:hypothetical protein [Clostridium thailandense]